LIRQRIDEAWIRTGLAARRAGLHGTEQAVDAHRIGQVQCRQHLIGLSLEFSRAEFPVKFPPGISDQ
jgi:hypothetical protein